MASTHGQRADTSIDVSRPRAHGFHVTRAEFDALLQITPTRAWLPRMGSEQMHQLMHHAHARALVSLNLHRRHLNESQRAMVAAKIATMQKGGDRGNQHTGGKASIDALPQSEVAEILNVSRESVQRATKVVKSGDEKLIADVESGEVTVSAAAKHVAAVTTKQKRPAPLASLFTSVRRLTNLTAP
jgi:hypothetical protein